MNAYLEISNLTKRYGSNCALDGVSLALERGSTLALLGPNGAGKSTLFGCVLGLTTSTSGEILLEGKKIAPADRKNFGYVAERVSLYPQRTVMENAAYFARLKGLAPSEAERQVKRVGMAHVADRKAGCLSKGMLQRLGLAIALSGQPELLVLDEPFNGLDPVLLDTLQTILGEEHARGATMLISTHTMSAVEPLATHVAILLEGRLATYENVDALRLEHGYQDSLESIYHQIARQGRKEIFA